jgi:hypothetical protein
LNIFNNDDVFKGTFAVWKLDDTPIEQQQVIVNTVPPLVRMSDGHTKANYNIDTLPQQKSSGKIQKIPISKVPILHRAAHRVRITK